MSQVQTHKLSGKNHVHTWCTYCVYGIYGVLIVYMVAIYGVLTVFLSLQDHCPVASLAVVDMHACERAYNVWAHGKHLSCLPYHDEVPIWMIYHHYSPWHFTPQDYASKTSYSGACGPSRGCSFIGFCLPTVLSALIGGANPSTIQHKPYYTNYNSYYYTNIITNYTNIIILLRGN